ncbi:MAG TPA: isoprenylcysteine carboxylmethyltransferase family protein [Polyangiaceae bacterium]|jgi:protein-S-isoprenylcysteine O-methyltransferase Ste14|nr:isoprenylcysteine carboxylmethyltransferase family protein [Polyangiaceae bacterium]
MSSRLLLLLFRAVAVAGVLAAVLPWILYVLAPPFPGLLVATLVSSAVVGERLWGAFGRMPEKAAIAPERDWTAVAVGLAFVCELYAILAHFHLRQRGFGPPSAAAVGVVLYAAGFALRTWASRTLGSAWAIQLDRAAASGTLIRTGPYRFLRHPIYAGAMVDAVGIALLFGSVWGFACAVLLFCPAEIARARFEEGFMRARFGASYAAYEHEVGGFFPHLGR